MLRVHPTRPLRPMRVVVRRTATRTTVRVHDPPPTNSFSPRARRSYLMLRGGYGIASGRGGPR
jgi:hypothetical protein